MVCLTHPKCVQHIPGCVQHVIDTPRADVTLPEDEWDAIALSYTSGTTGNPKGVVTHHRGAYLASVGNVLFGLTCLVGIGTFSRQS